MVKSGDSLGPYELGAVLGEGGMGRVFVARRPPQNDALAVKVMRDDLSQHPNLVRRFLREARAMGDIRHSRVVEILDSSAFNDQLYIVMRHVAGRSLDCVIAEDGVLALAMVARIVVDVASGLDAVHAAGLIHRDVKPSNVMVGADSRATLMDLGLAKRRDQSALTGVGQMLGTLNYFAPELIRGDEATASSDIYALACTAFEALVGRPPFGGGMFEVGLGHLDLNPPLLHELRAEIPPEASEALGYGLAKSPADRPPTAMAFAAMLSVGLRR